VETVIHERQDDYYRVLAEADNLAQATPFVEFIFQALLDTIREAVSTDQGTDQVSGKGYRPDKKGTTGKKRP